MQEQDAVRSVYGADGVHESGTLHDAAQAVVLAAADRLEVAVGVVGVQDHQLGLLAGADGQRGRREADQGASHCFSSFLMTIRPSVWYAIGLPSAARRRA